MQPQKAVVLSFPSQKSHLQPAFPLTEKYILYMVYMVFSSAGIKKGKLKWGGDKNCQSRKS